MDGEFTLDKVNFKLTHFSGKLLFVRNHTYCMIQIQSMEMRFSIIPLSVRLTGVYCSLKQITHLLAVADAFLFKAQLPLQVLNDGIFRVLDLGVAYDPWCAGVLAQEPAV